MGSMVEQIVRHFAPELMDRAQVQTLIAEEVRRARQAIPIGGGSSASPDGYRRLSAGGEMPERDLTPMGQDLMLELAYYLYDSSGLVKRFVRDTRNFCMGEGVTYAVGNDTPTGDAKAILDEFWGDSINRMDLKLGERMEFLGLLGEQCWPVWVNPVNGLVRLSYADPVNVDAVEHSRVFPDTPVQVRLKGTAGRPGQILPTIREEMDPRQKTYGRLVGECFFFAINKPPNASRGRSDLIHAFDFINGFEESIFDEIDRIKLMKSFIWDVLLTGATEDDITDFLKKNKTPKAGSVRAHNEQVEWNAVAPDLKFGDTKSYFDFMKSYLAACQNRPDSWLGSGGKAYQTEADLMGEPTFKDLGERQRYVKYMLEAVLRFVLDQAVIHGRLREKDGARFCVTVNMPEMAAKNLDSATKALESLARALMIATDKGWVGGDTATTLFAAVASMTGVEVDAAAELKKAKKVADGAGRKEADVPIDYQAREALIVDIAARVQRALNAA